MKIQNKVKRWKRKENTFYSFPINLIIYFCLLFSHQIFRFFTFSNFLFNQFIFHYFYFSFFFSFCLYKEFIRSSFLLSLTALLTNKWTNHWNSIEYLSVSVETSPGPGDWENKISKEKLTQRKYLMWDRKLKFSGMKQMCFIYFFNKKVNSSYYYFIQFKCETIN